MCCTGTHLLSFLDVLDGKEISETSRRFLHNWHDAREVQKKRREENLRKGSGEFGDGEGMIQILNGQNLIGRDFSI